jgi:hypothetical protein
MPPKSPIRPGLPTVAEAVAAMQKARARGPGRRSPLYLWLRENHDALTAAFANNAPAWASLAAYLGEHGIRDGDAKLPTARGARDAWWRVRTDVATARARRQGKPAPAMEVGETAPGVNAIPVPAAVTSRIPDETGEDAGEPPPRAFKTATLRGHTPSSPPPLPASPPTDKPAPDEPQDPDDVISRFVGRSTGSKFKPND